MHFRRGEPEDESKNDPLSKFGSSKAKDTQNIISARKTACQHKQNEKISTRP
jgi:hypothetical protein